MWTSVKSTLLNVVIAHTVPILLEATFATVNQDTLESGTSAMVSKVSLNLSTHAVEVYVLIEDE